MSLVNLDEARRDAIRLHDWLRREPLAKTFPYRVAMMEMCLNVVRLTETVREYERRLGAMEGEIALARQTAPARHPARPKAR